jgi:hypothetical protein
MSTLLVSLALAFFLQRTLVYSGITERNATLGTLALVLSPLYLMLSATFMSDIHGLFAMVLCLYGCLRALQSPATRAAIGWLCFAVATNLLCGTSRQLAWLGILVMLPSTLWLLRARRRVLFAGAAATLTGVLFILISMRWLKHQPYTTPETFHVGHVSVAYLTVQFFHFFLDLPFLLLPIVAMFLPLAFKRGRLLMAIVTAVALIYALIALYLKHLPLLEPTLGDWINPYGGYVYLSEGTPPTFLHLWLRLLLTLATFGGLLGLMASSIPSSKTSVARNSSSRISWYELAVLLLPFATAYLLLLIDRALTIADAGTPIVIDRYALGLLLVALVVLVRYYQEQIQRQLPLAAILLVALTALYGVSVTHNMFAFYRARVALAAELSANGIPDTSVDNGWEYNIGVELQHADHINNPGIVLPRHAYVPTAPPPAGTCPMFWYDFTPHIHPLYGASYDPNACYGPAPFDPVHYSRWFARTPGTLYVVRYTPITRP